MTPIETPTVFGPKAAEQIAQTVREVSRRVMNEKPHRSRWQHSGSFGEIREIRFKIASADPSTLTVLGEILAWDAGFAITDVPGQISPGILVVEVCDPAGCYFSEPADELFDRQGWARRMDATTEGTCRTGYPPFAPVWEVFALCCRNPSCDVVF